MERFKLILVVLAIAQVVTFFGDVFIFVFTKNRLPLSIYLIMAVVVLACAGLTLLLIPILNWFWRLH
jgi:hypothetical protein